MKQLAFIIHGKLRRKELLSSHLGVVFKDNYRLKTLYTEYPGHASELAAKAVYEGYNYIIVAGGDGSINEVANGIMKARKDGDEIFMGVLPQGTGNDFAKTMQVKYDVSRLKEWIDNNTALSIDLGHVEFTAPDGKPGLRYFINIADIGIGGAVAEKINSYPNWLGSNLKFQLAILNTFLGYDKKFVKVKTDNFVYEGKILNFIMANGKWFGSGMGIAPDAKPDDGLFEIVIAGDISTWDYIKNLPTIRRCQKVNHPELHYKAAREIEIESPEKPQPIDMDGEFVGYSPMKVKLVPKAVKFLCGIKGF